MPLLIRPMDLERDGDRVIAYGKDLFAISFGRSRFADQFGDEGAAYIRWIAEKQGFGAENAALALVDGEPAGMVLVRPWPEDPALGYVYHYYLEPRSRGSAWDRSSIRTPQHCFAGEGIAPHV